MSDPVRSTWEMRRIAEVCKLISSGGTPSRKHPEYYTNGHHLWVKSQELRDGRIYDTEEKITDLGLAKSSAKEYPPDTILMAMYGATVGQLAILKRTATVNQAICAMVVDPMVADHRFLYYSLIYGRDKLTAKAHGAAQQNLNQGLIRDFAIPIPPLPVQRSIADILSAYDDLIENNTRRIAILEEMAQAIYREWFVHFRFPGHEQVELVESELGPIPEGWAVVPASSAVEINPRIKVDRKEEKPYVPMGGLSERSMLVSPTETRTGASGSKFQNGDTLFARITPCLENGKTGFVQFLPSPSDVAIGSTEFIVLRSRTLSPEFVYLLARSDQLRNPAIKSMTGASGRQRVRLEVFDQIFIAHPTAELISRFRSAVRPMFDLIWALARKNENLRKTRDLLLPKLMSGEIDVEALESEPVGAVA